MRLRCFAKEVGGQLRGPAESVFLLLAVKIFSAEAPELLCEMAARAHRALLRPYCPDSPHLGLLPTHPVHGPTSPQAQALVLTPAGLFIPVHCCP